MTDLVMCPSGTLGYVDLDTRSFGMWQWDGPGRSTIRIGKSGSPYNQIEDAKEQGRFLKILQEISIVLSLEFV